MGMPGARLGARAQSPRASGWMMVPAPRLPFRPEDKQLPGMKS